MENSHNRLQHCYPTLSRSYNSAKLWLFFSDLCWGKAIVAYTKPQHRKKEGGGRLSVERDQIKFIDLRFEGWEVVRFRKARRKQDVP